MENAGGEDGVGFAFEQHLGQVFEFARATAGHHALKFRGGCEWQAAFALEKPLQPLVAGTAFAPDDFRRDQVSHFPAMTPPFQPVFVADRAFNRDAGGF